MTERRGRRRAVRRGGTVGQEPLGPIVRVETDQRPSSYRTPERRTLPQTTSDESPTGWGDPSDANNEEWYRRERPPHHEG